MKLKIAYVVTFYPTVEKPYHGIYFKDHAEALAEFEDVAVLFLQVPSLRSAKTMRTRQIIREENGVLEIRVEKPVLTHRSTKSISAAYKKAAKKAYLTLEEKWGCDPAFVIAQTSLPAGEIARYLKREYKNNYGVIEHFSFLEKMYQKQASKIKKVYEQAHVVGAVSDALADTIAESKLLNQNPKRIPNVLGKAFRSDVDFQNVLKTPPFKWLWIGDDREVKYPGLLKDVIQLVADNREFKLTVVGEGPFEHLKSLAQKLHGFQLDVVEKTGRDALKKIMLQHHALVSTSRKETFGMAVLEMLSLGRPVVVTPSGGPEQFVNESNGLVTPDFKPDSVAEAMQKIMSNYSRYNREAIRQNIINRYGAEAYYKHIQTLIYQSNNTQQKV